MPPYSADLSKRLVSLQEGVGSTLVDVKPVQHDENANSDSLFKLQVSLFIFALLLIFNISSLAIEKTCF
jgi:hypothetical protein